MSSSSSSPDEHQIKVSKRGRRCSRNLLLQGLGSLLTDHCYGRGCIWKFLPVASLILLALLTGSTFLASDYKNKLSKWGISGSYLRISKCQSCKPPGSEALPQGIVASTSDLEMRPLWGSPKSTSRSLDNLFAVAVGIKQKDLVNKMVKKFLSNDFAVMLFHYDGNADKWRDLHWNDHVIHVSAANQTKWWYAKRFLHPDIVAEYNYIFLWDEDLGVDHFHPREYIAIIENEGLEISQPALDPTRSEVHHQITARGRRSTVHRRIFKPGGPGKGCDEHSTSPPCTGWIEMMAPVFSRAAWRCVWYMIQNDLIYAWGLDTQLGYCVQGDRTKRVGIVDAEYIIHHNRPTLGGGEDNKSESPLPGGTSKAERVEESAKAHVHDPRVEVRRQSYVELAKFRRRWKQAVEEDVCWRDPYPDST